MKQKWMCVVLLFFGLGAELYADDAAVLPKNRFRLRWLSSFSFADQAYDSSGSSQALGDQYSQTIGMGFLSALRPETQELVKALNAVQPGMGDDLPLAVVDTKIDTSVYTNVFVAEYGLTERLSIGVILPLVHARVDIKANSEPSDEFQALMSNFPDGHPMRAALSSLQQQMSLEALSQTLQSELGYNSGISSWSGTGLGDIELGAKYNYYRSHPLMATVKTGLRLPTGRRDDPNELFDCAFGDGQFDLGAFHYLDYQATSRIGFTWEAGYTAQLPHSATYRIPVIEGTEITPLSAKLRRNPGDYWESGLEANWNFVRPMTVSSKYRFVQKFSDSFGSADGIDTSVLEDATSEEKHEALLTLAYSSIPDVRAGRSKLPFEASIFYLMPLAGKNIEQVHTTGFQLKSYF